ncbi:unnamed protein product [Closterium sp. NIES-65]|nr:unnamed protein product [Closterium sp. NIES-65]
MAAGRLALRPNARRRVPRRPKVPRSRLRKESESFEGRSDWAESEEEEEQEGTGEENPVWAEAEETTGGGGGGKSDREDGADSGEEGSVASQSTYLMLNPFAVREEVQPVLEAAVALGLDLADGAESGGAGGEGGEVAAAEFYSAVDRVRDAVGAMEAEIERSRQLLMSAMEVLAAPFDKHVGAVDALECFPPTAATSPSARGGLPPLPELRCPPSPSSAYALSGCEGSARWGERAAGSEMVARLQAMAKRLFENGERHTLFHTYKRRRGAVVRAALAAAGVGVEEREGAVQAEWSWEEAGQRLREWRAHLRFGLALCLAEQRLSEAVLGGMGHLRQECVDDLLAPSFAALLALPTRLAASPPSLHALLHALSTFHALRDGYPQVAELYPRRTQRQRRQYLEVLARVAGLARSAFLATETAWSHPSLLALLLDGQASGQGKGQATGQGQEEGGTQAGSERGEEKEGPVVITALTQADAGDGGSQQGGAAEAEKVEAEGGEGGGGSGEGTADTAVAAAGGDTAGQAGMGVGQRKGRSLLLRFRACLPRMPFMSALFVIAWSVCILGRKHRLQSFFLSLQVQDLALPISLVANPHPVSPSGLVPPAPSIPPALSLRSFLSVRPPQAAPQAAATTAGGRGAGVAACFQPITGAVDPVTLRLLDTFHLLCSHDLPYRRLLEEVLDTHPTPPPAASHASSPCASPHPALTPRDQQPPTPHSVCSSPATSCWSEASSLPLPGQPGVGAGGGAGRRVHARMAMVIAGSIRGLVGALEAHAVGSRGDLALSELFLMNNLHHIASRLSTSSVGKLLGLAEVGAHAKHEERHRDRFLELSFARFHCLVTNDRLRRPDAIRRLVEFCAVLGDVLAMQQTWVVPDPHNAATLRSALRWGLQQMLQAFLAKHRSVLLATSSISEIDEAWQLISEVNNSLRAHT